MSKVTSMDRMTAFGLTREQFREVYDYIFPHAGSVKFDIAWEHFCKGKAERIRKLDECVSMSASQTSAARKEL